MHTYHIYIYIYIRTIIHHVFIIISLYVTYIAIILCFSDLQKHFTQRTSFRASAWLSNGHIPGTFGPSSSVSLPSAHLWTLLIRNCGMVEGHAPNLNHQAARRAFTGSQEIPKFYFHQKHGKNEKVEWDFHQKITTEVELLNHFLSHSVHLSNVGHPTSSKPERVKC